MRALPTFKELVQNTWTGKIIALNMATFFLTCLLSASLFTPDHGVLIALGARDVGKIFQGEWSRYISSIFLHFGIIHFGLNMLALRVVGLQIESLLGPIWFLTVYVLSGIGGNIASVFFTTSLGVGASGAIFGLIGVGCALEYLSEWKKFSANRNQIKILAPDLVEINPKTYQFNYVPGPYSGMALLNIALAVVLNFLFSLSSSIHIGIDQGAHIGGLMIGFTGGVAYLFWEPNRLIKGSKRVISTGILVSIIISLVSAGNLFKQPGFLANLFFEESSATNDIRQQLGTSSRGIELFPLNPNLRLKRAELLIKAESLFDKTRIKWAAQDILEIPTTEANKKKIDEWAKQLSSEGYASEINYILSAIYSGSYNL